MTGRPTANCHQESAAKGVSRTAAILIKLKCTKKGCIKRHDVHAEFSESRIYVLESGGGLTGKKITKYVVAMTHLIYLGTEGLYETNRKEID
jgi:hypothetical protein